jgi:hypothetical protein
MSDYSISYPSGTIRLTATGEIIPQDDSKPSYQTYWAWVLAGGVLDQLTDPPVLYPRITVTAFQMMRALILYGLDEQIDLAVYNSGDKLLIAAYRFSNQWCSDCPALLNNLGVLGLNEAAAYELFQAAQAMPGLTDETASQSVPEL